MKKRLLFLVLLFAVGMSAIAQNECALLDTLKARIARDTTDWGSRYELAKLYREQSNSFEAIKCIQEALKIHESDTLKRELAVCYYNRGYYNKCSEICESMLYPDTIEKDLYLLTRSLKKTASDNFEKLLFYQTTLFNKNPLNWSNTYDLAQSFMAINDYEDALACLETYSATDTANLNINGLKARVYYISDRMKDVITECNRLVALGSRSPMTFYFLGMAQKKEGYFWDAIENLRIANEKTNGEDPNILAQYGFCQIKLPSQEEAGLANLDKAVELQMPNPKSLYAIYYNLGAFYTRKGAFKDAIAYYNKALEYSQNDKGILRELSMIYRIQKNSREQINCLNKLLEISDDSLEVDYLKKEIRSIREDMFMRGDLPEQSRAE